MSAGQTQIVLLKADKACLGPLSKSIATQPIFQPIVIGTRAIERVEERKMDDTAIGWIAAIIIGGIAGWLAEMVMKSNQGVLMNIVLGIVGAVIANFLLGIFGVVLGGWVGYLIAGFIGACILIAIARAFSRRAV